LVRVLLHGLVVPSSAAALIVVIVPQLLRRNPNCLQLRESFDSGLAVVTTVTALLEAAERHVLTRTCVLREAQRTDRYGLRFAQLWITKSG
jgi:hypothetical protein